MARQNIMREIHGIQTRMVNKAKSARRAGNRYMEQGAEEIKEVAQTLAPEDEGDLENAIVVTKSKYGNMNAFNIEVNEGMPGSGGANNVGQYATRMHEDPSYKLGPKSALKDQALGGNGLGYNYGGVVGAKFLTRAFKKTAGRLEKRIRLAIGRELR